MSGKTAEKVNLIKKLLGQVSALIGSFDGDVGWETCVEIDVVVKVLNGSLENLENRVLFRDNTDEEPLPLEAMSTMALLTEVLEQGSHELAQNREWLEKWCKNS